MTDKEQRVWTYIIAHRKALPYEVAQECGVTEEFVNNLISRIGTPEEVWRNVDNGAGEWGGAAPAAEPTSALDRQEGGSHYQTMQVQPWQAMEAWLTPEEYRGYHKGVALAYLARERQKGGDEDIKKAVHHLQRLIETLDEK